jgi:hypothetical protein
LDRLQLRYCFTSNRRETEKALVAPEDDVARTLHHSVFVGSVEVETAMR